VESDYKKGSNFIVLLEESWFFIIMLLI
jgi:hypothetical protein